MQLRRVLFARPHLRADGGGSSSQEQVSRQRTTHVAKFLGRLGPTQRRGGQADTGQGRNAAGVGGEAPGEVGSRVGQRARMLLVMMLLVRHA